MEPDRQISLGDIPETRAPTPASSVSASTHTRAARVGVALLRVTVAGGVALGVLVLTLWVATPSAADLQSRVGAATASHGATLLAPGDVPPLLAEAIVATEDERFYSHHGIDVIGLARAMLFDVSHGCLCQGGSTITEQLVKDLYLGGSDGGVNKLIDMTLALKVELRSSKAQILADYLSEVPTGNGLVGVSNAACAYFGQPLDRLGLAQVALLAGMPQAPSAYDPRFHPGAALARRAQVLDAMADDGYVSPSVAAHAAAGPLLLRPRTAGC